MTVVAGRSIRHYAVALTLAASAPAFSATFTGFDNNPTSTAPLVSHPNADAARDAFLAAAGGASAVRTNDFEALATGPVPATLEFGGGLQAAFSAQSTGATAVAGSIGSFFEFAISGTRYISSLTLQGTNFWTITFNQPLAAVGFYTTDPSDWAGFSGPIPPLRVDLTGTSGTTSYELTPGFNPTTINNASVAFFGVVDAAHPFTQLTLAHPSHLQTEDAVGLDNLMAVPVPEPATWITLLAGLLLLGWRMRTWPKED